MSTITTSNLVDTGVASETSTGFATLQHTDSLHAFYHHAILGRNKNSSDINPLQELGWRVYQEGWQSQPWVNDFRKWIALCLQDESILVSSEDIYPYVIEYERSEPELEFHDRRRQGISVDWKRARKLYRKMLGE